MIYRAKLRVKVPGDRAATDKHREKVLKLVEKHGDETPIHAAMQSDAMLDKGNLDGAAVWRRIVAAIEELQREEPAAGERRH